MNSKPIKQSQTKPIKANFYAKKDALLILSIVEGHRPACLAEAFSEGGSFRGT